jgi:ABC-type Fe3+-hydroxamate transport system substrate-binding protein
LNKIITFIITVCIFSAQAVEIKHELGTVHFDKTPKKIVALDWALAETLLSLDVMPQGVANIEGYRTWVAEPELNDSVIDVGSRREPNLELLTVLKPDVILISQDMAAAYKQLSEIAPTLVYSVYSSDKTPLISAQNITTQLGLLLDKEKQAKQVIAETLQRLQANGDKLRGLQGSHDSLLFIRFINDKTVRVHGAGSLAQATIEGMGLVNAWHEQSNLWGFTTAGIERLAEYQQSKVLIFGPLKVAEQKLLTQSALWQAMAFTRANSVFELPAIWTFGGLLSAQRFSDHITQQLSQ